MLKSFIEMNLAFAEITAMIDTQISKLETAGHVAISETFRRRSSFRCDSALRRYWEQVDAPPPDPCELLRSTRSAIFLDLSRRDPKDVARVADYVAAGRFSPLGPQGI